MPSRAGPGPRVWSKRGPPELKAPKIFLGHAIFLLDHALKFTGKTLLLGGHALLYTVGNTIFEEKALLISASGPAGLETFLEETENKEKIQNICLSGPLKAPAPLVTTLATPPPSRRSCILTSQNIRHRVECRNRCLNGDRELRGFGLSASGTRITYSRVYFFC